MAERGRKGIGNRGEFCGYNGTLDITFHEVQGASTVEPQSTGEHRAAQGQEAYASHIDRTQLVRRAYGTLGFADAGITEKTVSKGDASYTVSRPEITAADSGSIGVTVRYTMTVPFRAFGRVVAEIPIPVEINAMLNEKY